MSSSANEARTQPEVKAQSRLFDLRAIIAFLFAIYGVVLTVMGFSTSQADLDRAGGLNLNLWSGIVMLVVAALFGTWVALRPLKLATQVEVDETPSQRRGAH
jgi:uncharacterized membrane protein